MEMEATLRCVASKPLPDAALERSIGLKAILRAEFCESQLRTSQGGTFEDALHEPEQSPPGCPHGCLGCETCRFCVAFLTRPSPNGKLCRASEVTLAESIPTAALILGKQKAEPSMGALNILVCLSIPKELLSHTPVSWLLLGNILHYLAFCGLVGNPHLTAKNYIFARQTQRQGFFLV